MGEFNLAKNDTELNDAYRFPQGNEITIYITEDDNDDVVISNIDTHLSHLTLLSNEINLTRQKYLRTINYKQNEQEKRQQFYSEILETERAKTGNLDIELKKIKDSINSMKADCATYRESFRILVSQYQAKMHESLDLKKERDEKVMIEAKLKQLQKDLNEKISENLNMTQSIREVTTQRDHFNKKAEELESRQQNLETDYLNQSIKFTNSMSPHSPSGPSSAHQNSLPFSIPSDISVVDIQILLSMGIKLDNHSEQQKVFEIIRQNKDITKVMEDLLT
jgi:chromosome segregation ATPase